MSCSVPARSAPSTRFLPLRNPRLSSAILTLMSLCSLQLHAAPVSAASTTTLTISPGTAVSQGTVLTFQAGVLAGSTPVASGSVSFYDGTTVLAPVVVVRSGGNLGNATYKMVLGPGSHTVKAVFGGTRAFLTSTSATQTVTVTNTSNSVTATAITSTGSAGNYTLKGKVTVFGQTAPTGSVTFADQTNNGYLLGTAAVDPATMTNGLQTPTPYPAKAANYGIIMGDLNGDGIPDLVTSNYLGTSISVLIGNGDGTFKTNVDYTANSESFGIALGDLNGDGAPDLVVASHYSPTVSVFINNGDGTFGAKTDYTGTGYPSEYVVLGDFNGDGILDMATDGDSGINVFLGNGDGTFGAVVSYGTGSSYGYGIAMGDFNKDGKLDLVTSNNSAATVSVFLGNGNGTFQTQTTYPVSSSSTSVAVADLDGDGNPDLVVGNQSSSLSVLLGNGDGTFRTKVDYPASAWGVLVADVNGDGTPDIVASYPGSVSVLQGNGDGTFKAAVTTATGGSSYWVAVGDLNGDGVVDIAAANLSAANARVLLGAVSETATVTGISIPGGGTHNINASYQGDSYTATSSSTTIPLAASPFTTSLTLSFSPDSQNSGQAETITATLTPSSSVGYTAGGTVTFSDGGTPVGSAVSLVSGQAALTESNFTIGTHAITATYSGDTNFLTSDASAGNLIVNKITQTITFNSLSAVTYGVSPITLSATASSELPVTFSVVSGPATVSGNTLTITAGGAVVIEADQAGDSNYAVASPVQQTLTVNRASQTVNFPAIGAVTYGTAPIMLSANSTASLPITFSVVSGPATLATGLLTVTGAGSVVIQADQAGNANFAASSAQRTLTVNKAASTVSMTSSVNPVLSANPTTFTATVASTAGTPSGTVTFYDNATLLGTATLTQGVAAYTSSSLSVGSHSITAAYSGDGNFLTLTSSALTQVVLDFTVNVPTTSGSGDTVTTTSGGKATYGLMMSPSSGNSFPSDVTFTVTGLPPGATATLTPSVLPAGAQATNVVLSIQLPAQAATLRKSNPFSDNSLPLVAGMLLLPFGGLLRRFGAKRVISASLLFFASTVILIGMIGCGGTGSGYPTQRTYVVTVTATSGPLSHSTSLNLIVN